MAFAWGTKRRFHAWSDQCRARYGGRVQKVSLNAGFTCPNRDGTLGSSGCSFCNNEGFTPSYCQPEKGITRQLEEGLGFLKRRYRRPALFVAYFQAFSNTYAPVDRLRTLYEEALAHPEISGLVIATRPDCVDAERLDYIAGLAEKCFVKVEYGLESCHDDILLAIRRGHRFADSIRAVEATAARGLPVGAHLVFGLPGESRERMLNQVHQINALPLDSVKFHQLQIVRGTALAGEYQSNPQSFDLFGLDEYLDLVMAFLERLRPGIAVERISGEVPPPHNLGKSWGGLRTDQVLRLLEDRMEEKDTWQGRLFS